MLNEEELVFDKEKHKYFYRKKELTSVTTILKSVGVIDDRFYTEESKNRGTQIHLLSEKIDKGEIPEIEDEYIPYVDAYFQFLSDTKFKVTEVEKRVFNLPYFYAGTLDKRGKIYGDNLSIIDIKSGIAAPWAALQLAAYEACYKEPHLRFVLRLKPNGKYELIQHEDKSDKLVFLSMASAVNWKIKHLNKL